MSVQFPYCGSLLRRGLLQSRLDYRLKRKHGEAGQRENKACGELVPRAPSFLLPCCLLIGASVEEREIVGQNVPKMTTQQF